MSAHTSGPCCDRCTYCSTHRCISVDEEGTGSITLTEKESGLRVHMQVPRLAADAFKQVDEKAAALLKACKEAAKHHQGMSSVPGNILRAAIAKAEGK